MQKYLTMTQCREDHQESQSNHHISLTTTPDMLDMNASIHSCLSPVTDDPVTAELFMSVENLLRSTK